MLRNFKVLLTVFVVIAVAGSAYAFAATNTVPDSAAGYKANVVPGYTVTNIVYDLNATDPTLVDKITFDIAPSSGSVLVALVKVQTVDGTGTWKTCTLGTPTLLVTPITCAYTSPTLNLIDVDALNVVASSSLDPS
jgi:hypothetical protein